MSCRRCPHHVKHGFAGPENKIEFVDYCGLKIKQHNRDNNIGIEVPVRKPVKVSDKKPTEPRTFGKLKKYPVKLKCDKVPFPDDFEYMLCPVYRATFQSGNQRKDVMPTKDFEFTEVLSHGGSGSIMDMELL